MGGGRRKYKGAMLFTTSAPPRGKDKRRGGEEGCTCPCTYTVYMNKPSIGTARIVIGKLISQCFTSTLLPGVLRIILASQQAPP